MNKKKGLFIILFISLITLSSWYLFFQKKNEVVPTPPANTAQQTKKDLIYEKYKYEKNVMQGAIQSYRIALNKIIGGKQTYTIIFQLNKSFKTRSEASRALSQNETAQTIEKITDDITIDLQKSGVKYPLSVFTVSFIQLNGLNITDLPD